MFMAIEMAVGSGLVARSILAWWWRVESALPRCAESVDDWPAQVNLIDHWPENVHLTKPHSYILPWERGAVFWSNYACGVLLGVLFAQQIARMSRTSTRSSTYSICCSHEHVTSRAGNHFEIHAYQIAASRDSQASNMQSTEICQWTECFLTSLLDKKPHVDHASIIVPRDLR